MTYYKIIKNENIIDANFIFLKWDEVHYCMILSGFGQAQFAQSSDQSKIYHDNWMPRCPNENVSYEDARIVIINKEEYLEIKQQLNNEEEIPDIPEQSESEDPQLNPESEPEPETVMTVSQMRSKILEQQQQINMLTDCLLEMSEIIYA